MWITSAGDDVGPPLVRGGGDLLQLSWDGSEARGQKTFEFQFGEPVQVHDGGATFDIAEWTGADLIDYVIVLNATAVTSTSGTGNCNLVATGLGYNIIVPATGGSHTVDLSAAVPVPSTGNNTGYWDADYDTGAITASTTPGAARFHLFDTTITNGTIRRVIFHNRTGTFTLPAYGVSWIHPNWKLQCRVTKNSASAGRISGWIRVFRRFGQI